MIAPLLGARRGGLWIGTSAGLSFLNKGKLTHYPRPKATFSAMAEAPDGTLSVAHEADGQDGPLCRISADDMRCFGDKDGVPHETYGAICIDGNGDLWIGGERSVVHGAPGRFRTHAPPALRTNAHTWGIAALACSARLGLIAGIAQSGPGLGLQKMAAGKMTPFTLPGFDGTALSITALFVDTHEALWIGTSDRGVYRFYNGAVHQFRRSDGLSATSS